MVPFDRSLKTTEGKSMFLFISLSASQKNVLLKVDAQFIIESRVRLQDACWWMRDEVSVFFTAVKASDEQSIQKEKWEKQKHRRFSSVLFFIREKERERRKSMVEK